MTAEEEAQPHSVPKQDLSKVLFSKVKKMLKEGRDASEVAEEVEKYSARAQRLHRARLLDLRRTEALIRPLSKEWKEAVYPGILRGMGVFSSEKLVVKSKGARVPLDPIPSFTAVMNLRSYKLRAVPYRGTGGGYERLYRVGVSKALAYEFGQQIGARIPERSSEPQPLADLQLKPGMAVKPQNAEGSRGVHLIHETDYTQRVKDAAVLTSLEETRASMQEAVDSGAVRSDLWVTEEIIYEDRAAHRAGRDFKFYCFYGSCPLVLEVVRYPELGYTWWNADGTKAFPGKYEHLDFEGIGVPQGYLEEAQRISREIPAPFVRIDTMNSDEGRPVVGEYTPHPGDYERFSPEWDNILGAEYLQAEQRLLKDFLEGKKFPFFMDN